jgi:hypothetical protein
VGNVLNSLRCLSPAPLQILQLQPLPSLAHGIPSSPTHLNKCHDLPLPSRDQCRKQGKANSCCLLPHHVAYTQVLQLQYKNTQMAISTGSGPAVQLLLPRVQFTCPDRPTNVHE